MDKNNSVLKIAVAEQVFAAKLMYLSNDIINKLIKSNKIIFAKLEKINPILILDEIPFSKYQIAGNQNRRKMSYQSSRILLNLAECIKTKKLADSVRKLAKN